MSHAKRCLIVSLFFAMLLSGCKGGGNFQPPPKADDKVSFEAQQSTIAVPISADLSGLAAQVSAAIPKTLWSINQQNLACVPSKKVKVVIVKIKTPTIKCDIVGQVTRGQVSINGQGQDIVVKVPLHAVVQAKDIGGILKQETASADASAQAVVHVTFDNQWNPRASVDISYSWSNAPHIDFLGQRIEFTKAADKELAKIVSSLERVIPQEIDKLQLRNDVVRLWNGAFTSVKLNDHNPEVWMRITPEQLQYGGFNLTGKKVVLQLGMRALTETFVGARPPDPAKIPLPPLSNLSEKSGKMTLYVPVVADYAELEPVVERALAKRAERPFDVPTLGQVTIEMVDVVAYGTTNGRIALGLTFKARPVGQDIIKAEGQIWITALPVNEPNSREIHFQDPQITGDTNKLGMDLLLKIAKLPAFSQTISDALTQNFEKDYDELMVKIDKAIGSVRTGDVIIRAKLDDVETGKLQAAGQGLFLPVKGTGTASLQLILD